MSIERLEVVLDTCTLNPMVKKTVARFTPSQSSLSVSGKLKILVEFARQHNCNNLGLLQKP